MKRKLIVFLGAILLLIVSSCLIGYYYLTQFGQEKITAQTTQLFILKKGTSIQQLANQMEREQLLADASLLPYFVKISPSLKSIKAGAYQLTNSMTVHDFLLLLVSGKEVQFTVQFIEGKQVKDALQQLALSDYLNHSLKDLSAEDIALKLGIDGSIEGWLYPDTYHYVMDASDITILKRAYQRMQFYLQTVWNEKDAGLPYQSPYQLLIMASIIEKETGIDSERAKIASVFVNRLNRKMRLQTDPTIIYGMGDAYQGNIKRKDLNNKDNPYNTYVIFGLPPTPIAMPSLASLKAAAHPEKTNYLYFVADNKGGHVFSTTYAAHQKAVNTYWQERKGQNR